MSLEQKCNHCMNTFPATTEFFRARSRGRGLEKVCKACWREKIRAYRQVKCQHGEREVNPRRQEIRTYLDEIKLSRGCTKCGYKEHPAALDFHHLSQQDKVATIASLYSTLNLQKILAEVAKCEVLCANCHRIETYHQKHPLKPEKPVEQTVLIRASQHFKKRKSRKNTNNQTSLFQNNIGDLNQ